MILTVLAWFGDQPTSNTKQIVDFKQNKIKEISFI